MRKVIQADYFNAPRTEEEQRQMSRAIWTGPSGHLWHVQQIDRVKVHLPAFRMAQNMIENFGAHSEKSR